MIRNESWRESNCIRVKNYLPCPTKNQNFFTAAFESFLSKLGMTAKLRTSSEPARKTFVYERYREYFCEIQNYFFSRVEY